MSDNPASAAAPAGVPEPSAPLIRMRGISKSFPGVRALSAVDLEVRAGEVLALMGENGAGKSTLIRVLGGAHRPDSGSIEVAGRPALIDGPLDARRAGIAVIYQEFNLVPALSARENMFLGQEPRRLGFIPAASERRRARELFERLDVKLDPDTPVRELTVAGQQIVEIARSLVTQARVIVMDEPTAALSPREVASLFRIICELQSQGIGIVYVSHRLDEVFQIADRVTVLRDGEHVATQPVRELTRERLIELMVGRRLENEFPPRPAPAQPVPRDQPVPPAGSPDPSLSRLSEATNSEAAGPEAVSGLVVRNLSRGRAVRDVSLHVRRGEIVALTGLVGAGRTEVARLIFGADRAENGQVLLDGRPLRIRSPRDAIAAGICLLTEDRKQQGLVLNRSVRENFGLPNLRAFSTAGLLRPRKERAALAGFVDQLRIRVADVDQPAASLSGGNQQKVVLAKWLQRNAEVILFDEPTRGIDVGARYEIYVLMQRLAAQGKAVLMISSELPEVLGLADRILVMHDGRITGELTDVPGTTQEMIMDLATR